MICETFLPHIFFRKTKTLSPVVGALSTMTVKKAGPGLLNPVTSSQEKYLSSTRGSTELVRAMTGGEAFYNADHLRTLSEEQRDGKKSQDIVYESRLKVLVRDLKVTYKRLLLCAKITGAWLRVCGTTVSGTVLSDTKFRDFLCARYNVSSLNLQSHCDGCGTLFRVRVMQEPNYNVGGLVIACHKKIRDKLLYLPERAFTSTSVRAEPLIHQGRNRYKLEIHQGSYKH